jgi:membrane protein YqaA with SNARE-associated domain
MPMEYIALFFISFFAATILPVSSELTLVGMMSASIYSSSLLLLFASVGNVLGSCVNWYLGIHFIRFKDKKWFPFSDKQIQKSSFWFEKYGLWSLLFAWVPIVGDPLTFVAGILKINFFKFLIFVTIGKIFRYWIIVYSIDKIFQ